MASQKLKAEKREILGRKVNTLRREGILPANIYGRHVKSEAVSVSLKEFEKVFGEAGETGLIELQVDSEAKPVLVHNIQKDPVTDFPIHVDFLQVNLKEKVTATVPIEFTGESPVSKSGEGVVIEQMSEVEVEALPSDLPEKIVVDISDFEKVDDSIKVSDLKIDRDKVDLKADAEAIVVNVAAPAKEEEVAPPVAEEVPAEGVVAGEGQEAVKEERVSEDQSNQTTQKVGESDKSEGQEQTEK